MNIEEQNQFQASNNEENCNPYIRFLKKQLIKQKYEHLCMRNFIYDAVPDLDSINLQEIKFRMKRAQKDDFQFIFQQLFDQLKQRNSLTEASINQYYSDFQKRKPEIIKHFINFSVNNSSHYDENFEFLQLKQLKINNNKNNNTKSESKTSQEQFRKNIIKYQTNLENLLANQTTNQKNNRMLNSLSEKPHSFFKILNNNYNNINNVSKPNTNFMPSILNQKMQNENNKANSIYNNNNNNNNINNNNNNNNNIFIDKEDSNKKIIIKKNSNLDLSKTTYNLTIKNLQLPEDSDTNNIVYIGYKGQYHFHKRKQKILQKMNHQPHQRSSSAQIGALQQQTTDQTIDNTKLTNNNNNNEIDIQMKQSTLYSSQQLGKKCIPLHAKYTVFNIQENDNFQDINIVSHKEFKDRINTIPSSSEAYNENDMIKANLNTININQNQIFHNLKSFSHIFDNNNGKNYIKITNQVLDSNNADKQVNDAKQKFIYTSVFQQKLQRKSVGNLLPIKKLSASNINNGYPIKNNLNSQQKRNSQSQHSLQQQNSITNAKNDNKQSTQIFNKQKSFQTILELKQYYKLFQNVGNLNEINQLQEKLKNDPLLSKQQLQQQSCSRKQIQPPQSQQHLRRYKNESYLYKEFNKNIHSQINFQQHSDMINSINVNNNRAISNNMQKYLFIKRNLNDIQQKTVKQLKSLKVQGNNFSYEVNSQKKNLNL